MYVNWELRPTKLQYYIYSCWCRFCLIIRMEQRDQRQNWNWKEGKERGECCREARAGMKVWLEGAAREAAWVIPGGEKQHLFSSLSESDRQD